MIDFIVTVVAVVIGLWLLMAVGSVIVAVGACAFALLAAATRPYSRKVTASSQQNKPIPR